MNIEKIATIETDFETKFGIPRQSGIVKSLRGRIVFEEKYRNDNAVRGLEGFSHIWVIWGFSKNKIGDFSPTVRPPRLGGNERVGVFASRSPFRPNGLGLSCLRLEKIEKINGLGTILEVSGADMANGTPIYDIKPYLSYTDSVPYATGGFAYEIDDYRLNVIMKEALPPTFPSGMIDALKEILAEDPRPSYIDDDERVYGFCYCDHEIKFKVKNKDLTVISVEKREL